MNEFIYRFMNESEYFLGIIGLGLFIIGGLFALILMIKSNKNI